MDSYPLVSNSYLHKKGPHKQLSGQSFSGNQMAAMAEVHSSAPTRLPRWRWRECVKEEEGEDKRWTQLRGVEHTVSLRPSGLALGCPKVR